MKIEAPRLTQSTELTQLTQLTESTPALQDSITPPIHQSINPIINIDPWPEPVSGALLLDALRDLLRRFVVLPKSAAETLALWILHTYAFELRDVTTYIGVESPQRRCGKTTLLTILSQLVNRPVVAANVSSPSFFRAIEELRPTLMIDEADRFLRGKHELQGILNAGYSRKTAFVLRVAQQAAAVSSAESSSAVSPRRSRARSSTLAFFSCWCPKLISQIGQLPETLADRCIIIRMQRKTSHEQCERLRNLDAITLKRQCARFVLDHSDAIADARPEIPATLNDRAADIWEPLLALADLAGGAWPGLARQAAIDLAAGAQENNPIGFLLFDIFMVFTISAQDRLFTRELLFGLNKRFTDRPWMEFRNGKEVTEMWLAQQLRPYGVRPRTLRVQNHVAKGYFEEDFKEAFRRYIPPSELAALRSELTQPPFEPATDQKPHDPASSSES